jgi:type II secretory pathway component GspD/PulD (secretin)
MLRNKSVSLRFHEEPLAKAVQFLSDALGLPIDIDREALDEEGVTPDTPVTLDIENIPADDAMDLLLCQLNLAWVVADDTLVITSQLQAGNSLVQGRSRYFRQSNAW